MDHYNLIKSLKEEFEGEMSYCRENGTHQGPLKYGWDSS